MVSKEDYLKFMSEVRKVSGVDTLTPDETGLVSIRVDEAYNVNLQFVEATGKMLCFVEVVQLPPDAPQTVYRDLLVGGLFGKDTAGGYFAIEPETETVVYNYSFDLDRAAGDVENFIATLVYCVTVSNLTANAAVAFGGLPDYYGTSSIYADAGGCVYLWLPEDWAVTNSVTPHLLSASPRQLLGAPSGTSHAFAANGYSYTVTMSAEGAVAEQGAPLELEGFRINDFVVGDGVLSINVSAKPDTWLYGFFDRVVIRSSRTLPIPNTSETVLDTSAASVTLEDDGSATYTLALPPAEGSSRFFTIDSR